MKIVSKLYIAVLALSMVLAACGGGGSGGGGGGGVQNSKVFVTSVIGNGNLSAWADAGGHTGLAAGDAICQARANAAGLSGTFKAWLSDSSTDAYCHIHGLTGQKATGCGGALSTIYGPWVRMDGFPFGETIDIITGIDQIYAPVRFDEAGNQLAANSVYFTNTTPDGEWRSALNSCTNWTVANTDSVGVGYADQTAGGWTQGGSEQCTNLNVRLLCMRTGAGPALPSHTSTGKIAFVTSTSGNGNLSGWSGAGGNTGIAAGDAICRARATAAFLPNAANFKAWLSDSSNDAITRITTDGPWVRIDGVRIADSKADLTDAELFSSINLTETGFYLSNSGVLTGTEQAGLRAADNCTNWTSNSTNAREGRSNQTTGRWTAYATSACSITVYHLYCFED